MKVPTKISAPGQYELNMEDKAGMYFIRITQQMEDGGEKLYQTGFSVPYSEEYLLKGINKPFLNEISSLTGGGKLKKNQDAFAPIHKSSYQKRPFSEWLFLSAFLLFFLEIATLGYKDSYQCLL